jgi:hypothetical protein
MLLGEDGAQESDDAARFGEDAAHVGPRRISLSRSCGLLDHLGKEGGGLAKRSPSCSTMRACLAQVEAAPGARRFLAA